MTGPNPFAKSRPSPQPNKIYGGSDVPAAYDPNWQHFTNLTKDQIKWFQSQPEWADFVAQVNANPAAAALPSVSATISAARAARLNLK